METYKTKWLQQGMFLLVILSRDQLFTVVTGNAKIIIIIIIIITLVGMVSLPCL